MNHKRTALVLMAILIFAACHKDNEEENGNLLGAWQVNSVNGFAYDSEGNLQDIWDDGLEYTYVDYNEDGILEWFIFRVSPGDNWVFVNDTTVLIKDKVFTYHHINLDGEPYIRIDIVYNKYKIVSLTKKTLSLKYIEIYAGNNVIKEEITFDKL